MSELSAGGLSFPGVQSGKVADNLAREAVFNLLYRLQIGSLSLHEGGRSWHFGDPAAEPAEVHVLDPSLYREVLRGGAIAAGRTYFQGLWTSPSLVNVTRIFSANMAVLQGMDSKQSLLVRGMLAWSHLLNRNTRRGSKDNISAHYDLGNDFFQLFLDPTMMYSSAVFERPDMSLEEASIAKLDELCRQLELTPDDHLLEIGTGWGGMAIHAARNYGCRVTTTTISREQFEYAVQCVEAQGLSDRVTVLCEDYRNLEGTYDKLVSIEMIEAVGHQYYGEYFRTCSGLLRENGKMVIQAITVPDQRYRQARDSVDFIKRYIFPGGCLPSNAVIADHIARDTDMQVVHLRDITLDYAETLAQWRERFLDSLDAVRDQGFGEEFIRMWEYYLCYCEGGFRERIIGTVQMAFAKPGYRD
ncbi:MAG: class I SAM-dependent methyltransferase [Halioglobus sp.]